MPDDIRGPAWEWEVPIKDWSGVIPVDTILRHFFALLDTLPGWHKEGRVVWIMRMEHYQAIKSRKDADGTCLVKHSLYDPAAPSFGRLLGHPIAINDSVTEPMVAAI